MKKEALKNYDLMENFTLNNIPDLDTCVLGSLELFMQAKIPSINAKFKRPLVIGSGNAEATGKIIFKDSDAVFANENNYKQKLKQIKNIDGVIVISASGGKHAPLIVKEVKSKKKKILFLTNNSNSQAAKLLSQKEILTFPKQREPYTYNTSTYMSMILSKTKESPSSIYNFINSKIKKINFNSLKKYYTFYIILPPEFELMRDMLDKKFVEMFGRRIPYSIYSTEYIKHATTIVPSPKELFISIGYNNKIWGKNRLNIPLPPKADYAMFMAVSYYIMGQIQKSRHQWFKSYLLGYTKKISKIFKHEIKPIVE